MFSFVYLLSKKKQILTDSAKARREVDLHHRAAGCKHIVRIADVFENIFMDKRCLVIIMERLVKIIEAMVNFISKNNKRHLLLNNFEGVIQDFCYVIN